MANTVIQLRKSSTPSAIPASLEFGELAINYADGKLYYKNTNSQIAEISGAGGYSFGTVNANNVLIIADTPGDVLTLEAGANITIVGDAINDKITISAIVPTTDISPAFNQANTARTHANAAFDQANSSLQNTSTTLGGSLTVAGTLTTTGNIELGNASDTTLARSSAGNVTIEGNIIYRAGGTDVTVADGGTGASDAATARTNLGVGNTNGPIFAGVILNNRAGTSRYVQYHTNNSIRWGVSASGTAESGSNTGSDYVISRWADDGSFISNPFLITRSTGSVKIGGAGNRSTTEPTNALSLFNGTAPVGTLTNGVTLYASAGELRVMDSAGNATLLSPHDDITNEWIFDSTESTNGRNLRIRVEALLRKINSEFGWDYVLDIAGDGTDQSKTMAERVNEEREKRLATFTFNGKLYDLNRTAKTDIAGAGTLALSAIMLENAQPGNLRWADPTSDFGWIAYDNTITLMDAQTTLTFAKEAAAHYKKIIFAARSIKDMNPIPEDFMNDSYWS